VANGEPTETPVRAKRRRARPWISAARDCLPSGRCTGGRKVAGSNPVAPIHSPSATRRVRARHEVRDHRGAGVLRLDAGRGLLWPYRAMPPLTPVSGRRLVARGAWKRGCYHPSEGGAACTCGTHRYPADTEPSSYGGWGEAANWRPHFYRHSRGRWIGPDGPVTLAGSWWPDMTSGLIGR
jgi:hypothetical protein